MTFFSKSFVKAPLLASLLVVGFAGCDSTPPTPTDPSPPMPKEDATKGNGNGKVIRDIKSKDRGQNPTP